MAGAAPFQRIADNYSASVEGYAEFWSPVIHPVARRMLEGLPLRHARRVLDVGVGTGALVRDILNLAPQARLVGIDPAAGMLRRAIRTGALLAMMDAMFLGFRARAFDVAVMAFVLFHMPAPRVALVNVARVLRRPGAVGVTTWAEEFVTPAGRIWDEGLDATGARDPSPQPSERDDLMNTPERLAALLRAGGFEPVRAWIDHAEHRWTPEQFMGLRTHIGATKRRLSTLPPSERGEFLRRMGLRMAELPPDAFRYRRAAVCAVATV